jgi:hypothetical protein
MGSRLVCGGCWLVPTDGTTHFQLSAKSPPLNAWPGISPHFNEGHGPACDENGALPIHTLETSPLARPKRASLSSPRHPAQNDRFSEELAACSIYHQTNLEQCDGLRGAFVGKISRAQFGKPRSGKKGNSCEMRSIILTLVGVALTIGSIVARMPDHKEEDCLALNQVFIDFDRISNRHNLTVKQLDGVLVNLDVAENRMHDAEVIALVHRFNNTFADFLDVVEIALEKEKTRPHPDDDAFEREVGKMLPPISRVDEDFRRVCSPYLNFEG